MIAENGTKASAAATSDAEFEQRFAHVEVLLAELARAPDPGIERAAREIVATVLELHRRGLERLLDVMGSAQVRQSSLLAEPRVSAMLLLHGLHPSPLIDRVSRTLNQLTQRYSSKVTRIESDVTEAGEVLVRVLPEASACQSTRAAIQKDIEESLLSAAPDVAALLVEFISPPPALIPLRIRSSAERARERAGSQ